VPEYVDSEEPKGNVTDESPAAHTNQTPGTTITLSVSKGPQTVTVPSVLGFDSTSAESTIMSYGFQYETAYRDVTDPSQNDIVQDQSPKGNKQADPNSTVTIYIGNYVAP
ncbi:MAG TPA: PASTA domain-containing protein, partial [Gaiellaceae bacterium]